MLESSYWDGSTNTLTELWWWRRLLRVSWTARRSNRSILKEINSECALEGLMLKLKFQPFGHLMWRANSLEKTLMLGKVEGRRRRGWQRMGWLDGITDSMNMSLSKIQETVVREAWCATIHGMAVLDTTWQQNHNNSKQHNVSPALHLQPYLPPAPRSAFWLHLLLIL